MDWWWWILIAVGFFILEIVLPGSFVAFFFGVAALVVSLIAGLGIVDLLWLQWVAFSLLAILALLLLRKPLQSRLVRSANAQKPIDSFIGETAKVIEAIPPNGAGRVEMRGTTWVARSKSQIVLAVGANCIIESVDGLTMWVKAD